MLLNFKALKLEKKYGKTKVLVLNLNQHNNLVIYLNLSHIYPFTRCLMKLQIKHVL
jgi:hypothetical protein